MRCRVSSSTCSVPHRLIPRSHVFGSEYVIKGGTSLTNVLNLLLSNFGSSAVMKPRRGGRRSVECFSDFLTRSSTRNGSGSTWKNNSLEKMFIYKNEGDGRPPVKVIFFSIEIRRIILFSLGGSGVRSESGSV